MSRLLGASLIVVLLYGVHVSASDGNELPRQFGTVWLGMPATEFTKSTGAALTRCATCAERELYSELPLRALPQTRSSFEQLGFNMPNSLTTANVFFFEDRLYSIRVGEFDISASGLVPHLSSLFHIRHVSRNVNGSLETKWSDKKTTIVVSGTEKGSTDVIATDIDIQKRIARSK
jgi:hypothetical protein